MEPRELSISEAIGSMERGELSSVNLAGSVLDRVQEMDGSVNAFITVRERETVIKQARLADERRAAGSARRLEGIPIAVKDNFATQGIRTTAGSRILADWVPDYNATCVQKLIAAGAIVIGKLNMHEFANGPTTDNPHYGRTNNPWDVERTPGGSSGGSGAALASDMCLGATGSDTGGSIRAPAAFCGIVGLKPTYGLISRYGVVPFSWSLDHVGPMARNVLDTAALLDVMAGYDPKDPGSSRIAASDDQGEIGMGIEGTIVGVETSYLTKLAERGVRETFERSIETMAELGATITELTLPIMHQTLWAELAILFPEAASLHRRYLETRLDEYGRDVRQSLLSGRLYSAVDYVGAQRVRAMLLRELSRAFEDVDILAMPTMIIEAPEWGQETFALQEEEHDVLHTFVRCLAPFNLSGTPALSLPCGFGDMGLPVGLELAGPAFSERKLLRIAYAVERALELERRKPSLGGVVR